MKRVALIPARGGSKRIPRKNIKPFRGQPVIGRSIEVARRSGLFDRVVVSTDDDEIAQVALSCGAEVPFRRTADLAGDHVATVPVIVDAIQQLRRQGDEFRYLCCIYPAAPFVRRSDLETGYRAVSERGFDFAFTATTYGHPVQRALRRVGEGVEPLFPDLIPQRSQDLVEALHDAGQFYWGNVEAFESGRPIFGTRSFPVILPRYRVQDIDTAEDWVRAELLHEILLARGECE